MNFTENQLYNFRKQFRFLDHAPIGAALMKNGIILYANPKLKETFGYTEEDELVGKEVGLLIPQKLREKLRKRDKKREEGIKQPNSYKSMSLRKNGTNFTSQIDIDIVEINGEVFSLGYVSDLADSLELAKVASVNGVRFLDLLNLSPLATCLVQDRRVLYANQPYLDLVGYSSIEEVQQFETTEFFAPEYRENIEEIVRKRESGSYNSETYEAKLIRKDRSTVKIRVHAKRTEGDQGVDILAFLIPL